MARDWSVTQLTMRRRDLFALLVSLGCERAAPASRDMTSSSTPSAATAVVGYAIDDTTPPPYEIAGADSAYGAWGVSGYDIGPGEFYIGSHVRHPSGLMVIWFDTAVRATEEHPVGHVHTDSVVVNGVRHLEYLGRFCFVGNAAAHADVVGLVQEGDTLFRPRLAWRFNTSSLRIEPFESDSLWCRITDPLEGEVD